MTHHKHCIRLGWPGVESCEICDAIAAAVAEALEQIEQSLKSASEEHYQDLKEWEAKAGKWKDEGDMYGWNFFQGMAAGANWCDILYQRIGRGVAVIRAGEGKHE